MMLWPPVTTPKEFYALKISDEVTIHFFGLFALTSAERDLKLEKGSKAVAELLAKGDVTELLNLRRACLITGEEPGTKPRKKGWLW